LRSQKGKMEKEIERRVTKMVKERVKEMPGIKIITI
jgi:hypothetical protein